MCRKNLKKHFADFMLIFFIAATAFIMLFIFSNSLEASEISASKSGAISEKIQEVVDSNKTISIITFHRAIRKVAHLAEFSLLGLGIGGIFLSVYLQKGKKYISLPILIGLSVGIIDEFLQSFTTRKSLISDVMIDFVGVLIGFLIFFTLAFFINKIRIKVNNKTKNNL